MLYPIKREKEKERGLYPCRGLARAERGLSRRDAIARAGTGGLSASPDALKTIPMRLE